MTSPQETLSSDIESARDPAQTSERVPNGEAGPLGKVDPVNPMGSIASPVHEGGFPESISRSAGRRESDRPFRVTAGAGRRQRAPRRSVASSDGPETAGQAAGSGVGGSRSNWREVAMLGPCTGGRRRHGIWHRCPESRTRHPM
jgi:hypothetical protein